jgi:RNA recognition motif-containing protein
LNSLTRRREKMTKKIFVGNLHYDASEDALREVFSEIGEVESVKIITDMASGRSKGFGFIEMSSEDDVEKAIERLNNTKFMDRTLIVNKAKPQTDRGRRGDRTSQRRSHSRGRGSGFWR